MFMMMMILVLALRSNLRENLTSRTGFK